MKRVRFQGRSMTKFDMCCRMCFWHHIYWVALCDVLDYAYIAKRYNQFLKEKHLDD